MIKPRGAVLRCELDGAIILLNNLTSDLWEGQYCCALCPVCPRDDSRPTRKVCPVCGVLDGHAPNNECPGYQRPEEVFGEDQKREQLLLTLNRQRYLLEVLQWMAEEGTMYEFELRRGVAENPDRARAMMYSYARTQIDKLRLTESFERARAKLELFDLQN